MMTSTRKSISDEYKWLIQKQIHKPKQKNQYTKDSQFTENFKQKKQSQVIKDIVTVQLGIPSQIQHNNVFRLHSNVQFPRNADSCNQLGGLNIDFYSYNYIINRIDRNRNLTTVTYEPIERPFMPVEAVKEMMIKGGERLLTTFDNLNSKKLNRGRYQIIDQKTLLEFEKNISKPFVGYVSRVEKDRIVTKHRIMNDLYLAYQGINEEMLIHYVQETGLMTIPFFFAENDCNTQHLSNFFLLNTFDNNVNDMQGTNYRGEKFPIKVTFNSYFCFDEEEKCYYEYLFFIWDCDKKWNSKKKIMENFRDYFNLKDFPSAVTLPSIEDIQDEQRCGYKQIA